MTTSTPPVLVNIVKPIYGGAFLAHIDGKAVFVPLTLPGEQARIRIAQSRPGYSTAEAEEIIVAAPERMEPACRHFGACGGCHYQHANYESQLLFKQAILRETLERGGVHVPLEIGLLSAEPWSYRNRIRVAFDSAGNPGYRGRRSHAVVPIVECPIAAPILVQTALAAAELVHQFAPLRPTEIALFCDAEESSLLVSIFTASAKKVHFDDFIEALKLRVSALTGAELIIESRDRQPPRTVAQWGATSLAYRAAGFDYRVAQGAFFQVNRWLVDGLVELVAKECSGAVAWDLFAGVGLFARRLTDQFERVVAVESASASTQALTANLKGTRGIPFRATTLDFLRRSHDKRPDFIALDPPRTGLGAETTAVLAEIAAHALAYVSCDPATLARDLRALIGSGYELQRITLVDLFPQTFHLETVVHLRRG